MRVPGSETEGMNLDKRRLEQRGSKGWRHKRAFVPLMAFGLAFGTDNSGWAGSEEPPSPPADAVPQVISGAAAVAPGSPQEFFESVKGLVFPLKTALGPGEPKRSYGTAFVVDSSGILATNFHVVSDVVSDPDKYNLYLEVPSADPGGATAHLGAEIIALDIVHDLALVKVERQFGGAFKLASEDDPIPSSAERVWSLGKPLDLAMALVEGNFNGEIRMGDYSKFFLSTPINQGMSGGPTVDTHGVVRGVNFAILTKTQNVSFAVPGRHLTRLLAAQRAGEFRNPEQTPPGPTQRKALYRSWIAKQVASAGARLVDDITGRAGTDGEKQQIRAGAIRLAELPGRLKCWQDRFDRVGLGKRPEKLEIGEGDGAESEGRTQDGLSMTLTSCDTGFSVDISKGREVGDLRFGVLSLKSTQPVVTPRDWKLLGGRLGESSTVLFDGLLEKREGLLGRGAGGVMKTCRRTPVKNSSGLDLDLGFCIAKQARFPELLDAAIRISGGLLSGEAFAIVVQARGFALEDLQRLSASLLEGLRSDEGAAPRQPASAEAGGEP